MDETAAELKARAIASLRSMEASLDSSEQRHRYTERGQSHVGPPSWHESYNDALRLLQRAGEDVQDWEIRPPHLMTVKLGNKGKPAEWIDASGLRADIKRILARVDPQPD